MEIDEDFIKVNVPADGSCLFWSVVLAYLVPVKNNKDDFENRYTTLFGNKQLTKLTHVHDLFFSNYTEYYALFNDVKVQNLVFIFRNRVVEHISKYKEKYEEFIDCELEEYLMEMKLPNTWGGEVEIRAMSDMLESCFEVSGVLSTTYGSNFNFKIHLIHVSAGGSNHDRNHYNFYLKEKYCRDQQNQNKFLTLPQTIADKQAQNHYSFVGIPKFGTTLEMQPIPTPTARVVRWSGWYTEEQIKLNSNLIFLFGDNDKAKYRLSNENPGGSGQALVTRPTGAGKLPFDRLAQHGGANGNAVGITTTFYGDFIPNFKEFQRLMDIEFVPLEIWVKGGGCLVVPCNSQGKTNLGTGIAALEQFIPGAIEYINKKVNDLTILGQHVLQQNIDTKELKTKIHLILFKQRQSSLKTCLNSDNIDFEPRLKKLKLDYQNDDIADNNSREESVPNSSKVCKRTIITDNDREVDELKKLKTVDGYIASGVKSSLHGTIYQLKLLMLFLKRGIELKYSFCLATEMDRAEKFDDVVFQYIENGKKCCRFLQAKHKQDEKKKITMKDLLTENDDEFSLQKYFISCNKIKTHSEFIDLDFIDFVICTNIDIDEDLKKYFQLVQNHDNILDIKLDNKDTFRYKLKTKNCELKEKLSLILQNTSDLRRLVKRLAEYLLTGNVMTLRDDIIKEYHGILAKAVIDVENIDMREFASTKKFYAKFHTEFLATNLKDQKTLIFRIALMECYWKINKISIKERNEDNFLKDMATKQFNISRNFGRVFRPESDLNFNNSDLEKFVQAIVNAIDNATDNIVIIKRESGKKGIIKDNIKKLAGYILIKKEDEKNKDTYYFSLKFLNELIKLPGDLEKFRRSLFAKMKTKHINFDKTCYKFRISNFLTCEEDELFDNTRQELPTDQIHDSDINDFLQKLVFAVNQPDEITLGEIIKKELGKDFNNIDSKNVYARFLEEVLNWMKEKEGRFFTYVDGINFFNKLSEDILGPVWFNVKKPVRFYTGRKESLNNVHNMIHKNKNNMTVISQMATVSGLGGIGKTELAKRYVLEYGETYDNNVIWIDAENESTLEDSFYSLAKDNRLGIPTKDKDHADKPMSELVKEIYRFFSKRKCLFIFDNAEIGEYLSKFLPLRTLTNDSQKPFILITSRIIRDDWEQLGIDEGITLDVFTYEESLEFIKKSLSINENYVIDDDIIKDLAGNFLFNFPLALEQMVAYIREQNKKTKRRRKAEYSFKDYIIEYKAETKKLLNDNIFRNLDNDYAKTTYTTWKMTVNKIQDIDKNGFAIDILELIAYFAPNKIPVECFCKFMLNEEDVWNSVEVLNRYSMVKLEEGFIDVHRLVQEVTRIGLQDKSQEADVAKIAFDVIQDNFPYDIITSTDDCSSIKTLLPHLEHLLIQLKNLISKDPKYKEEIEADYLEDLLEYLINAYTIIGHPNKQVELFKWAIQIGTKQYGDEDIEVARLLSNFAICQEELGNYSEQRKLLERVLYIEENANGDNDVTVASTLVNLSVAYDHLGQDEKSKTMLERALNIQRNYYGDNHVKVAITLGNLGIVYGHLGDRDQQKLYLEEALAIEQKHYGGNHYEYAKTLINLGNAYGDSGDHATQLKMIEKALAIQESHYGDKHHVVADTLVNLSDAFRDSGNVFKQKELLEKALQIQQSHYGHEHITVIDTLVALSKAHYDLGEIKKQKECLEQALLILETHEDDENFEDANTMADLGNALENIGNHELQKKILEKSLQVQIKHCGKEYFGIASTIADLATAYGDLEQYDKQKQLLEQALAIQIKHFGEENIEIVHTLVSLSLTEGHLGSNNQQQILLDKVSVIIEKHWNTENLDVSNALVILSNAYGELEKHSEQIIMLSRALEIAIKYYGERHTKIVDILIDLSNANENIGNYQDQKCYLEKALKVQRNLYGDSHLKLTSTLIELSKVYGYLNDHKNQNIFLQLAYRIQTNNHITQTEDVPSIEEYLEI